MFKSGLNNNENNNNNNNNDNNNALNMNLDSILYQKDFVFRNLYYCTAWI